MQRERSTAICESCVRHERGEKSTAAKMVLRLQNGSEVRYFYVPGVRYHDAIIKRFSLPDLDHLKDIVGASFDVVVERRSKYPSAILVSRHA